MKIEKAFAGLIALPVAAAADAVELVTGDAIVKPEGTPSNVRRVVNAMTEKTSVNCDQKETSE